MHNKDINGKKPSLFLFTTTFPYGSGEVFLKSEIDILSDVFSEVYIIPSIKPFGNINHQLKDNVFVVYIDISMSRLKKISLFFSSIPLFLFLITYEIMHSRQRRLAIKNIDAIFFQLFVLVKKASKLKKIIHKKN